MAKMARKGNHESHKFRQRRSLSVRSQPDLHEAQRELPARQPPATVVEDEEEEEHEIKIDAAFLENVTANVHKSRTSHRGCSPKCSIYKVPPCIRDLDPDAYTPQVVSIGPCHYSKNPSISHPYKYMQDCKWRILDYFISQHTLLDEGQRTRTLMSRCLEAMRRQEVTIRSYYSYEISRINSDELAMVMMLDGCFILYLLLETKQSQSPAGYYVVDGARIRSQLVKYDLLLVENQIPFFVIKELHMILATGEGIGVIEMALEFLQDFDLPRNKISINPIIAGDLQVLHLLDLFHMSLLPTVYSRESKTPVWALPCASELKQLSVAFDKKKKSESFLDINFCKKGITRKRVMEIPPLKLYDSTRNLFCNLIAFEQCHPNTGFNITAYIAFMDCLIDTEKDVRLLHLKGILINCMTGYQDLTHFFRCLCTGAYTAEDRFYLANVFQDVIKYQESEWNVFWAEFRHTYCGNKWAVFAAVVSVIFFVLAVFQTFFAVFRYYKHTS